MNTRRMLLVLTGLNFALIVFSLGRPIGAAQDAAPVLKLSDKSGRVQTLAP